MEINQMVNIPKLNLMFLMIIHMTNMEINQMEQTKKTDNGAHGEEIYNKNSNKLEKYSTSIELFGSNRKNFDGIYKEFWLKRLKMNYI